MTEADRIALRIYLRLIDDIRPFIATIAEQERIAWPNQPPTEALSAASDRLDEACLQLGFAIHHQPGKVA